MIDDHALLAALREGRIAGAGIDVLRNEPPREGDQLIDNLEAFVRGEPRNLV